METATQHYYEKRGAIIIKNLRKRHFEAYYCATKEDALTQALALIPQGSSVGWGGATSAKQIGLLDAVRAGSYNAVDRDKAKTPEEKVQIMHDCLSTDYFITGANALSIDGQMVNIDRVGNRVGAIIYGPKNVLVIAGMNKVCDTIEDAVTRTRTVASPMNQQRFLGKTPCSETGICANCISEDCLCNQITVTRNCYPTGRIKFILVGEDLGF